MVGDCESCPSDKPRRLEGDSECIKTVCPEGQYNNLTTDYSKLMYVKKFLKENPQTLNIFTAKITKH